jgi:transposase InsO family protein
MPWKQDDIVELRKQFIYEYLDKNYPSFSYLCQSYGISRPTGYKWIERFVQGGINNLADRSRAPKNNPNKIPEKICQLIIEKKLAHKYWGPKKILDNLRKHDPTLVLPADSTAGEILKRKGLVKKRRKRWRVPANEQAFDEITKNNQVWSVDYKGHFTLGNGTICYPLTITDGHSRFLLRCQGLNNTRYYDAKSWMEQTFREYGLPDAIRSDNGSPFASIAAGGISRLSMWWIQLGIRPERIKPGHPQQNGRHERMHKTLKEETTKPPAYNEALQQKRFDDFLYEYNHERSHEALARKCPDEVYQPSTRPFPEKIKPITYDEGLQVRTVKRGGEIKWKNKHIYISQVLSHEKVSLEEIDNDVWEICYGFYKLGIIRGSEMKLERATQWHKKKKKN